MAVKKDSADGKRQTWQFNNYQNTNHPMYGLGVVGTAVYYFQRAEGFEMYVLGFLKALVWPAIVAYKLLESFYS